MPLCLYAPSPTHASHATDFELSGQILPPLLDLVLHRRSLPLRHWVINISILVLGVTASVLSSALTMKDIVEVLRKE